MATTVDTLLVRIESDMSELRRDLKKIEQQTQTSTKKVSSSFKTMALAIKATIAVVVVNAVKNLGTQMVRMASDTEEGLAKASAVFGTSFKRTSQELEQFGNTVGRSTQELVIMASTVQDTFVPMGFARDDAAKLSVQLSKLAVDVASFNNASDVETMRAFQSAIVGNHETVRRFGVVITEATLKQELNRMGIRKSMKEVTNAEKVQARLNLIINGTKDAHGDAEKTAGSFANQQRALNAALRELSDNVMSRVLPDLADFLGLMTKIVDKVAELADPRFDLGGAIIKTTAEFVEAQTQLARSATMQGNVLDYDSKRQLEDARRELMNLFEARRMLNRQNVSITPMMGTNMGTATTANIGDPNRASLRPFRERAFQETTDGSGFAEHQRRKKQMIELRLLNSEYFADLAKGYAQLQKDSIKTTELNHNYINQISDGYALEHEAVLKSMEINEDYINQLGMGYAEAQQQAEKLRDIQDTLTQSAIRGFDRMENAMLDFADGTTKGFDGIKDAMRFFLKDLQRTILRMTVFNKIKNAIFGLSGANALPTASMGQIGSNIMGMFGTRAGGGSMQRGRPYLVGERGAELFVPNVGGTLMNNMNTRNMGGGATIVNQTINVETGVAPTVRAEIMNLLPSIKRDTITSLIEAKKRGGNFATAFS